MKTVIQLVLMLALGSAALPAAAQATSNVSGTIDSVVMDEAYIVIDGKRLVVREDELVITYQGNPVRASLLSAGLSVIYSTRTDGSVSELVLLGPARLLERIEQQ